MTQTPVGRGRHRRPRPRKVLFAVGGLALAAGALSLVRVAPESGVGGLGSAEAGPRQDPGAGPDRSDNAVATVEAVPRVSPSATSVMGGASTTPAAVSSLVPLPSTPAPRASSTSGPTTLPEEADTPAPTATPRPPTTAAPAPRPTSAPGRSAPPPAPQPSGPDDQGDQGDPHLCVPVVGLCVGLLGG